MSISICIPTWNRFDFVIQSFEQVLHDDRVSEIILVDDASTDDSYEKLKWFFRHEPKVKLFQNSFNLDCYYNKKRAVELATNEWCCLWDSDNIFSPDYLDVIFDYSWDENTIHTPDFAMVHFDFRAYSGLMITRNNVAEYIDKPMFETMCNACNLFVNRNSYLQVWDNSLNPITSDSIYFVYKWLESGKQIFVTPALQYVHRVHSESHYQNNTSRMPQGLHANILQQLRELK